MYYVKIDGCETDKRYNYQQLKDLGVLKYDDVYIREENENNWTIAKYYIFKEHTNSAYEIDEFGQIRRKSVPIETSSSTTPTLSSSNANTGKSEVGIIILKVLATIVVALIAVAITGATVGVGSPIFYGAYLISKKIWGED